MSPKRRERKTPKAPAAHQRIGQYVDPQDTSAKVADRLIAARVILTGHVVAYEQVLAQLRSQQQRSDPLLDPDAPHNRLHPASGGDDPDDEGLYDDDLDDDGDGSGTNPGRQRAAPFPQLSACPGVTRAGLTKHDRPPFAERSPSRPELPDRYRVDGWPSNTSLCQDHWYQLRWRPWRRFDEGQRRLDRIEMGEWWQRALREQEHRHTERQLDKWVREQQLLGVVFAGPTDIGWLPDPALARVVVWGRRLRRTAMWILWLPDRSWSQEAFDLYRAHTTPEGPAEGLLEACDAISRQPQLTGAIAAELERERTATYRRRRHQ